MESLYLKYRPQRFDEIVGQEEITRTLLNSIKNNRIVNSYLFYGPRGCGKTSTARILAKALNCHNREGLNPCNACISCVEISNSSSIDVLEIDAASHTQVQNIRDVIIDSVHLSPARDRYKIYILDEVHMLSTSAFNALLKTIEEPPSHAVFILATTEIGKVPLTVVSRCQTFRFRPVSEDVIVKRLEEVCKKENIEYDYESLSLISLLSAGSIRDALGMLEKISSFCNNTINGDKTRQILGYPKQEIISKLALSIIKRDVSGIHFVFDEIKKEGYDVFLVLKDLRDYFSKRFLILSGLSQDNGDLSKEEMDANRFIYPRLSRKINRIIDEIRYSDNPLLLAETFIYTLIDFIDLDELFKELDPKEKKHSPDTMQYDSSSVQSKSINNLSDHWKKVLNYFLNENYALYNALLSVKVKFDSDRIIVTPSSDVDREIILNNIDSIRNMMSQHSLTLIVEDKKKPESEAVFVKKDISQDGEIYFPEYEKIKKVFGDAIVRVIRNEVSPKIDK